MVNLQSTPITNTLAVRAALLNQGAIVATLDPGDAQVLTLVFNQVMLVNPGHPPVVRNQNPVANVAVTPGNVAYLMAGGGGVALNYAQPNGPQRTVQFT
jgi:hypothetical protein